jgi:adenosine kinase
VNDYEARLVEQKTGLAVPELARRVEAVVVTRGAEGSEIHTGGQQVRIPAVKPDGLVDPTGCGDAFRAGLLHGLSQGWDWPRSGRLASLMGSIKIAHRGGQNHKPTRGEIERRYLEAFGESL